jgi:hypothetical protein
MDAFTARLGVSEGRIERVPGDVVFALGDVVAGWTAGVAAGDFVEVAQTADLTGVAVVRVTGTLRAPAAGRWRASLRVGGFDVAVLDAWAGRSRPISDLAANVSGLSGHAEIAVRLSFLGE